MGEMQAKYPDDKFEVILRKVASSQFPEWRVKCLDCPGKVSDWGVYSQRDHGADIAFCSYIPLGPAKHSSITKSISRIVYIVRRLTTV